VNVVVFSHRRGYMLALLLAPLTEKNG